MAAGTLIIGAGQGGYQVAASLREAGYAEPVTIVGDEPALPYQRPPLSKAYLLGDTTAERLQLRPSSYYEKHAIAVVTGDRATAIDRAARRASFASGKTLPYDHLVLALGAQNRKLPVPGAEADGVLYLRTLAEADAIKQRFHAAQRIVVAGAGFIGLELAAVASKFGKEVTVVEALSRCMSRAVSPVVSHFFAEALGHLVHFCPALDSFGFRHRIEIPAVGNFAARKRSNEFCRGCNEQNTIEIHCSTATPLDCLVEPARHDVIEEVWIQHDSVARSEIEIEVVIDHSSIPVKLPFSARDCDTLKHQWDRAGCKKNGTQVIACQREMSRWQIGKMKERRITSR